ncbi:hypothetical protein SHIRM173S_04714 [Streptomyces hirsutus]
MIGSSLRNVPLSTSSSLSRWYSASEPSHQTTWSGWVSSAISLTQEMSPWWVVGTLGAAMSRATIAPK